VLRWAGVDDCAVAVSLGADVPFCLAGGRARVTGVGEGLSPLPFQERSFVLLIPPLVVPTPDVYRAWDARRAGDGAGPGTPDPHGNDLEAAALDVAPALARWRDLLGERTGRRPRLAGSGATWFVEGEPGELGLAGCEALVLDGLRAPLVAARTVPAPA